MLSYKEFCKRAERQGILDVAFSLDYFYKINESSPYDVSTIAYIVKRSKKTVRKWFSEGRLKYVDTYPYSALGIDLLEFLFRKEEKVLKKKFPSLFLNK
jgi:hypothetical protein